MTTTPTTFFIPGSPVSWKRPRQARRGGKSWRFTDPEVKAWQETVQAYWMQAGRPLYRGYVSVTLSFALSERDYKKKDVDNLAKAILDALNGLAYPDDRQVSQLHIFKQPADKIGATITLELVENLT
jgi:Holliday junction resolvase RusA-like endonuclease